MKFVVIVGDGMPDYKNPELDGKTPLQHAYTPNMDALAQKGEVGLVQTIPEGCPPGSDVANLSVLGYDPLQYYRGRSPFEAVSMGVELGADDVSFRCNLVTLSHEQRYSEKQMVDYSAGEITTEEAVELITLINDRLGENNCSFFPGISYRHLMVWRRGPQKLTLTPPHDIHDLKIKNYLPQGEGADILVGLMEESARLLTAAPVNLKRQKEGKKAANSIWLWGQGSKPALIPFKEKYGLEGVVISAVDLVKGLGKCAGLEAVEVEGATGNLHTNFRGKAEAALAALAQGKDFAFIHIEAPDEASHQGNLKNKIKAIENIDAAVIGPVIEGLREYSDFKIMVLADHYTPLSLRTHSSEQVPFLIYQKGNNNGVYSNNTFDEEKAKESGISLKEGFRLMGDFLGRP